MHSTKKRTGRTAGVLYLVLAVTAAYGIVYVPEKIDLTQEANQTVARILEKEFLLRTGIFSHLLSQVIFVFLGITLYKYLKQVHELRAKLMLALVLVQIPVVFIIESAKLTALGVAKGQLLLQLTTRETETIVSVLLKFHSSGIATLELFWGLWLIPFGLLIYRSGFAPKIPGILLLAGGFAYMAESLSLLLLPALHAKLVPVTMVCYAIAEIWIILWLLFIGAKQTVLTQSVTDNSDASN